MTLFLLGHHCDACGLRVRTRNLCCGLSEPGFETRLTEPCVIARNQCSLADFRSRVTRVWISDDFARIFEQGQAPPYQFIQAKLFRASNFDSAIYRRAYRDPSYRTRDIVGSHRLGKHTWQKHPFAVGRKIGQGPEGIEEPRRMHEWGGG